MRAIHLLGLTLVIACGADMVWAQGRGHAKHRHAKGDEGYFERHGHSTLKIPKGHYPPPGQCRIWHPNRPPGHQPPPMACDRARGQVPPGAWVIRHPGKDPDHVHVEVYDERRPGSILVVGEFRIATGVFVRVVVDR